MLTNDRVRSVAITHECWVTAATSQPLTVIQVIALYVVPFLGPAARPIGNHVWEYPLPHWIVCNSLRDLLCRLLCGLILHLDNDISSRRIYANPIEQKGVRN